MIRMSDSRLTVNVVTSRVIFFFFQAEDGIRDIGVTGVQTCALPIWAGERRTAFRVVVITNGNFFAHLGLRRLLAGERGDIDVVVFVTTGLRRTSGNRAKEALHLARGWGLR